MQTEVLLESCDHYLLKLTVQSNFFLLNCIEIQLEQKN